MTGPTTITGMTRIRLQLDTKGFEMAESVNDRILEIGFGSDLYLGNVLVDMYCGFNDLGNARVFGEMPREMLNKRQQFFKTCFENNP